MKASSESGLWAMVISLTAPGAFVESWAGASGGSDIGVVVTESSLKNVGSGIQGNL
jgi:hypothetical protein